MNSAGPRRDPSLSQRPLRPHGEPPDVDVVVAASARPPFPLPRPGLRRRQRHRPRRPGGTAAAPYPRTEAGREAAAIPSPHIGSAWRPAGSLTQLGLAAQRSGQAASAPAAGLQQHGRHLSAGAGLGGSSGLTAAAASSRPAHVPPPGPGAAIPTRPGAPSRDRRARLHSHTAPSAGHAGKCSPRRRTVSCPWACGAGHAGACSPREGAQHQQQRGGGGAQAGSGSPP